MFRARVIGMALLLPAGVSGCGSGGSSATPTEGHRAPVATTGHRPSDPAEPTSGRSAPGGTTDTGSTIPQAGPTSTEQPPPYIAKVVWVTLPSGRSLQVYPTASGRVAIADGAEDEAWHEVLRKAPKAGTPGMRAQFDCHWAFARLLEPHKPSWNLEPWRPVVSGQRMYDTRCNPGGPEV